MLRRLSPIVILVWHVCGCAVRNPDYCCTTLDDCAFDEIPQCVQGLTCVGHECVEPSDQCTSNAECVDPLAPICGDDSACRACVMDDECATGACRADGSCEAAENVIYASPMGASTGTCPVDAACDLSYARSQITPTRFTIVLTGGTYSLSTAFRIDSAVGTLIVIGPRLAVFERASTGPVFDVVGGADFTVRGITIHKGIVCDSSSVTLSRVLFDEGGAEALPRVSSNNCEATVLESELHNSPGVGLSGHGLHVERTLITDGDSMAIQASAGFSMTRSVLVRNRGGGAWVTGPATITNNFIGPENGTEKTTSPSFGGLLLDSVSGTVEHNTVYLNYSDPFAPQLYAGGVYCSAATAIPNNLIVQNSSGDMTMPNANIGGNCVSAGSIVSSQPFTFVGGDDLHLPGTTSPAVNAGAPGTVTEDIDGQPRSDAAPDMGADEYVPPS